MVEGRMQRKVNPIYRSVESKPGTRPLMGSDRSGNRTKLQAKMVRCRRQFAKPLMTT
jgi:hypothetical protein